MSSCSSKGKAWQNKHLTLAFGGMQPCGSQNKAGPTPQWFRRLLLGAEPAVFVVELRSHMLQDQRSCGAQSALASTLFSLHAGTFAAAGEPLLWHKAVWDVLCYFGLWADKVSLHSNRRKNDLALCCHRPEDRCPADTLTYKPIILAQPLRLPRKVERPTSRELHPGIESGKAKGSY